MALKRITLRDFVIVQALDLDLSTGFTALTGETGAGKSILIDALQLTLGARADPGVVREGAQRTDVSAEFDCPATLHPWLDKAGFETDDSLLLRRTVDSQSKSRAWINGSPATASQLRFAGGQLIDIHGQHAWQKLTQSEAARNLLDAYAGASDQEVVANWSHWRSAQKTLEHARTAQESLQRERERLQWQIAEVGKLAPVEQEWEELNTQHTRLAHAQSLLEAAQSAITELDDDEASASRHLSRAHHLLTELEHLEPEFVNLTDILASSMAQAHEAARALQLYLRRTELDPHRLGELDARLSLWLSLARRYRRDPVELPSLFNAWKSELRQLDAAADLASLEEAESVCAKAYLDTARQLSLARNKAAPRLSRAISKAMQELGMVGGHFDVLIERATEPSSHGVDEILFRVASHAGTTLRPIAKVASGGELSRISLAIAVATSSLGTADTLIFDEVDSGVGGAVAETVGRLMQQLGHDRQVLAVTHLPQVASRADHHLVVSKSQVMTGASSTVTLVQHEQRVAEVARMLGGERISATTLAHAREMLESANSIT
ncbi:DNA repair protein RecN [Simplicispira psychrophila]|uniref:DNA repair protein RecN n=1 Tax=Simplicispira psychrophila TaxID=80882 RepID=UPI00047F6DB2|nr:DNA repair protein RecN [Simplicispira psychrophila]